MSELTMTRHAERRAQQRGVSPSLLDAVRSFGDLETPVGGGRVAVRLSHRAIRQLRRERGATTAERAGNVVLILAGNVLITVLRTQGWASRHYRRQRSQSPR